MPAKGGQTVSRSVGVRMTNGRVSLRWTASPHSARSWLDFPACGAFRWTEAVREAGELADTRHARSEALLHEGVGELRPGEVYFECDQTFAFDSTFSLKGDGRKFVIIASQDRRHVAKPY